jgi:hypothetical protein
MQRIEPSGRKPRHQLRLPCQVVRERDFRLIADRVDNLSVTGLSVSPAEPVLTGEKLIVSFRLPRQGVWIDAEACVTRVMHGRRPGEDQRCLGLAFEQPDRERDRAISRELAFLPPVPPGRSNRDEPSARILRVLAWFSTRIEPTWEFG